MKKILITALGAYDSINQYLNKKENEEKKELWKKMNNKDKIKTGWEIINGKENSKLPYRKTKYSINGEKMKDETSFIAQHLVNEFEPDEVYIIGTVKSVWYDFLNYFTECFKDKDSEADFKTLYKNILEENPINVSEEKLEKIEKKINSILRKYDLGKRIIEKNTSYNVDYSNKKITAKAIIIKYGIDEKQLVYNYEHIRDKIKFKKNELNDIAFDITHSFRSLPLYNLVILNYLKNVKNFKINISHIYYGNLDAQHDNKIDDENIAPIVDLDELPEVLELTNGVSEFKNTGNTVGLVKTIENSINKGNRNNSELESLKVLKQNLENFDLAMQVNDFGMINETLEKLMSFIEDNKSKDNKDNIDKYADIKDMIKGVINDKLGISCYAEYESKNNAEKRYLLANWYLKQNRYGLALITGMEALRSSLVRLYYECKKSNMTEEEFYNNENNRRNAYYLFIEKVASSKRNDKIDKLCKDLCKKCEDVKPLRNIFAHNLYGMNDITNDKLKVKKRIQAFINILWKFIKTINEEDTENNKDRIIAYYKQSTDKKKNNSEKVIIYVTSNENNIDNKNCISIKKVKPDKLKTIDNVFLEKIREITTTAYSNIELRFIDININYVIYLSMLMFEHGCENFKYYNKDVIEKNNINKRDFITISKHAFDKIVEG